MDGLISEGLSVIDSIAGIFDGPVSTSYDSTTAFTFDLSHLTTDGTMKLVYDVVVSIASLNETVSLVKNQLVADDIAKRWPMADKKVPGNTDGHMNDIVFNCTKFPPYVVYPSTENKYLWTWNDPIPKAFLQACAQNLSAWKAIVYPGSTPAPSPAQPLPGTPPVLGTPAKKPSGFIPLVGTILLAFLV